MGRLLVVRGKPPFDLVVRDHAATVFRVCCAVVGVDDADDAWSETFLAALKAYPELPADANLEAWLVTIAHRRSIDLLRARRRHPVPVADPAARLDGSGRPATHSHSGDVAEALSLLPDKQRRSIAYHYLAGLPYKEVAEILGGSADAARRAAADGIRRLRSLSPASFSTPLEEDR